MPHKFLEGISQMKNLKFAVLAFGVLGVISFFLPLIKFGDQSLTMMDAAKDTGKLYGVLAGFAIGAGAAGAAISKGFSKQLAAVAVGGFALAFVLGEGWKIADFLKLAIGAKLFGLALIGGLVTSIIALTKPEQA